MARKFGIAVLTMLPIVLAGGCQESLQDITRLEKSYEVTQNAENDVLDLVVRYHEARHRAAEYEPYVAHEQMRVRELQEELRGLRADAIQLENEVQAARARQEALEKALEQLQVEAKHAAAVIETAKDNETPAREPAGAEDGTKPASDR